MKVPAGTQIYEEDGETLLVMVLDILTRVFERSRIVNRYEIMASHDFASRT